MNAQERFWTEMYYLKVHACYLELYLAKTENIDRMVNFGIAITSTGSLGIWAFLKEYDKVWAALIVLSQVVAVGKSFLPYRLRVKSLASCVHEYEEHMVWAEGKWFDVAEGNLTEREIVALRTELQKRTLRTIKQCFPSSALPDNLTLLRKATARADTYFESFYGGATHESVEVAAQDPIPDAVA